MNALPGYRPARGSNRRASAGGNHHLTEPNSMAKLVADPFTTIADLRDTYITTPRDKILQQHLDRLLRHDAEGQPLAEPVKFTSTGDTHGIVLVEGPGGGKTSLVHHVLKNHPAFQSDDPVRRPWIGVRVPSPATLK